MGLIYSDLHIHSHYSRATSKQMNVEELSKYAKVKGVNLLGTGDATHPDWLRELKGKLSGDEGIYQYNGMDFLLSAEISLIYTRTGEGGGSITSCLRPALMWLTR